MGEEGFPSDALLAAVRATASLDELQEPLHVLQFGSSLTRPDPRDIDVMVVAPAGTLARYTVGRFGAIPVSVGVAPVDRIQDDIDHDLVGWGLLLKMVTPCRLLTPSAAALDPLRIDAGHRLLGAAHGTAPFRIDSMGHRVLDLIRRSRRPRPTGWTETVAFRESLDRVLRSAAHALVATGEATDAGPGHIRLSTSVRTRPPSVEGLALADWSHYLVAKVAPGHYLSRDVDDILDRKGAYGR